MDKEQLRILVKGVPSMRSKELFIALNDEIQDLKKELKKVKRKWSELKAQKKRKATEPKP